MCGVWARNREIDSFFRIQKYHMNTKHILLLTGLLLVAGRLVTFAGVNIFYQATLLDGGQPANGAYDLKFALYEKSTGGQPLGVAYTNTQVRITNGLVQSGLFCRNDGVRLKRGWVEAAIRRAGTDVEFVPMRARVDNCETHAAGAGKSCDDRCEFVTLRLHTVRLPFSFDPTQPRRGRGFVHLPKGIASAVP
jgi:hypothetical protein